MVVCGRDFSSEIIARIQAKVDADPQLSRRKLSREVCEWLGWRARNGGWQEGGCRKALAELNRRRVLKLPERAKICAESKKPMDMAVAEVSCTLKQLGEVTVTPIRSRHSAESQIARALLERHHPLGAGRPCGAQMRYVVKSSRWGYLGVLRFSSGNWALKERDKDIGWSEAARRAHLDLVVCNDRFLIAPSVKVKCLASHVLGLTLKRLPDDWEQRYAVRPVLAETFVEPPWKGTCYQAANWRQVGETAGRRDGIRRTILVCELSAQWRQRLCEEPPQPRLGTAPPVEAPKNWAEEEFGRVRFFDTRLKERLYQIAEDFHGCPQGSVPEACGGSKARTMGAYRFLANPKVTMDVVLTGHVEATIERIRQHAVVLMPQDTTTLNYTTHPNPDGLGPIGNKTDKAIGLLLHDTVAFSEQGTPLGVVDAQCWARDPKDRGKRGRRKRIPIEQKESRKWLRSFQKVAEIQKVCPDTKLISMGDRESDVYELFLEATKDPNGPGLLVRMNRSAGRKVGGIRLWDFMLARPVDGTLALHIPHSGTRKARDSVLDVRFAQVELQPPKRLKGCGTIRAWAVYVREQAEYAIDSTPIEWMLLTTVEVTNLDQARRRVQWYARRWGIEVYHRTLKSGCRILDRHLDPDAGLRVCLGIDMVVAWRVFHLTMLSRETPDAPCTVFFTPEEWQALCIYTSRNPIPPKQPPTIAQATQMVGAMGGHLGRKGDGPPGTKSLWRGLQRLAPATEMYVILTAGHAGHDPP